MRPIYSVVCPKTEDHLHFDKVSEELVQRDKKMFMFDEEGIITHCPKHGLVKFKFYTPDGKKVSFKDVSVKAIDIPNGVCLPDKTIPVFAYGDFERKKKKCQS